MILFSCFISNPINNIFQIYFFVCRNGNNISFILMGGLFSKLYEYLFNKKLEICLIGLENTGKTTFVNTLMGIHKQNIPTIGLNVKHVKKGSKYFIKI